MSLEKHIELLLMEHDCVIVPDFGGFVANLKEGYSDDLTHRFYPPSQYLTFNSSLKSNDGLLANNLKDHNDITYDEALSQIRNNVLEWKSRLSKDGHLVLGSIGKIYVDNGGKWRFVQGEDMNFLAGSFGLDPIRLDPVMKVTPVKKDERPEPIVNKKLKETKVIELKEKQPKQKEKIAAKNDRSDEERLARRKRRVRRVALAAACILPLAFYSYWIPSKTTALERGYLQGSDFNPFNGGTTARKAVYSGRNASFNKMELPEVENGNKNELTLNYEAGSKTYVISGKKAPNPPETPKNLGNNTLENTTITGNYHVIGGCFRNKSYADNLVEKMRENGYQSYILDTKNGLHRVSIETYPSKTDANSVANDLKSQGESVWVLVK